MPLTKEQQIIADFYETAGAAIKGHLIDIIDGPLVHNFILQPTPQSKAITIIKAVYENNYIYSYGNQQIIVQIPKETGQQILLENLLKSKDFKNTDATLPIILGTDTFGNITIKDLREIPHILVAGRTGCGKSVFLNCVLKSLKTAMPASECKFIIIDPKGTDYDIWKSDRHLMCPIVKLDAKLAVHKLREVSELIKERHQKLQDRKVKNIEEYKKKTKNSDMPYVVVIIDEFADLMTVARKEVEGLVQYITQTSRAVGVHLIIGTQHYDGKTLPGIIKAILPTRIAFYARTSAESKQILGERGAENLLPCADMLFSDAGRAPVRIHTAYIEC